MGEVGESPTLGKFGGILEGRGEMRKRGRKREKREGRGKKWRKGKREARKMENGEGKERKIIVKGENKNLKWKGKGMKMSRGPFFLFTFWNHWNLFGVYQNGNFCRKFSNLAHLWLHTWLRPCCNDGPSFRIANRSNFISGHLFIFNKQMLWIMQWRFCLQLLILMITKVASHQLMHIKGWRRYSFFMFSNQFLSYH